MNQSQFGLLGFQVAGFDGFRLKAPSRCKKLACVNWTADKGDPDSG
jgi:hypothetical protein